MAWGLPLNLFYDAPDWYLLQIWAGVGLARARAHNIDNYSTAQLCSLGHSYIRSQCENPESIKPLGHEEFLPFDFRTKTKSPLSERTKKVFKEVADAGLIPPHILAVFLEFPDFFN